MGGQDSNAHHVSSSPALNSLDNALLALRQVKLIVWTGTSAFILTKSFADAVSLRDLQCKCNVHPPNPPHFRLSASNVALSLQPSRHLNLSSARTVSSHRGVLALNHKLDPEPAFAEPHNPCVPKVPQDSMYIRLAKFKVGRFRVKMPYLTASWQRH
eukprot:1159922-Pelagomonas_calceolata.AAC.2